MLAAASQAQAEVWELRISPTAAKGTTPKGLLGKDFRGEAFCMAGACVLSTTSDVDFASLGPIRSNPLAVLTPLPDARKVYFQKGTYDAELGRFETDFEGARETADSGAIGQFVVVFKGYPEPRWLEEIRNAGLSVLEPLPPMGYGVYGLRSAVDNLAKSKAYIYRVADIPPGARRFGLQAEPSEGPDHPTSAVIVAVEVMAPFIAERLRELTGAEPTRVYTTGSQTAFTAELTLSQIRALSRLPEVTAAYRTTMVGPSDERATKIVSGTWRTPGTASPTASSLGSNPIQGTYHWDGFLASLGGIGVFPQNQTIGFLDTGVDDGLFARTDGTESCPPHLTSASGCRLVFSVDTSDDHSNLNRRGDDLHGHGTLVTSIAAGLTTGDPGRDSAGWALTQGVASGAKVAMSRYMADAQKGCGTGTARYIDYQWLGNPAIGLPYSLVELGSSGELPLPDQEVVSPGVRLFNHSWNDRPDNPGGADATLYNEKAILLDNATRTLSSVDFSFGAAGLRYGDSEPSLHVVSAGNYPQRTPNGSPDTTQRVVTAPGNAKNVITVGATSGLNQESFVVGEGCTSCLYCPSCTYNQCDHAVDARRIEDFSRIGYPNLRLKPDLVAPGTRVYGRRSALRNDACNFNSQCTFDLTGSSEFAWDYGTSFSAPVVTGAAALVDEWLTVQGSKKPSPALVKAALIASATNLRSSTNCASSDVKPAPDKYQGWGGAALDRLFRAASTYYYKDQFDPEIPDDSLLTPSTLTPWTKQLTVVDPTKTVSIALVWTDRAGDTKVATLENLVNDLNLEVVGNGTTPPSFFIGNKYYYDPCETSRQGYSLNRPSSWTPDSKNNVERVDISPAQISQNNISALTVKVSVGMIRGDGIEPTGSTLRQDFALFVVNARE